MKNWKKNLIVASVLVFVCAGIYMNWNYASKEQTVSLEDTLHEDKLMDNALLVLNPDNGPALDAAVEDLGSEDVTMTGYFAAVRLSRQQSRDSAVNLLQEAMAYGGEEGLSSSAQELEGLVDTALCEAQIESLVIAKGYADCVAYMTDSGISVAVAAPAEGLTETDAALISDIVLTQSDYSLEDIRIIEVKG